LVRVAPLERSDPLLRTSNIQTHLIYIKRLRRAIVQHTVVNKGDVRFSLGLHLVISSAIFILDMSFIVEEANTTPPGRLEGPSGPWPFGR